MYLKYIKIKENLYIQIFDQLVNFNNIILFFKDQITTIIYTNFKFIIHILNIEKYIIYVSININLSQLKFLYIYYIY